MNNPAPGGEAGNNAIQGMRECCWHAMPMAAKQSCHDTACFAAIVTPPIVLYHESLLKRMETWIHGIP